MLEIVFDRLVRLMTTSLRNFTSDNVEVSLDRITSVRFGDYLNSIPLPAILAVFKAEEWDNFGLITVNSSLIYSIIDVLLGGRRGQSAIRVEGRPYTTIESNLIKRMIEVVLADAELAFRPLSPVNFNIDRLETNPRFAAISRPANAAILVRLRIDMEDRGGNVELLLPYATIEPIATCCCRCSWARSSAATRFGKGTLRPRSARRRLRSMPCCMKRSSRSGSSCSCRWAIRWRSR
jgi:flagellar motor switch protein FliM